MRIKDLPVCAVSGAIISYLFHFRKARFSVGEDAEMRVQASKRADGLSDLQIVLAKGS